MLAHSRNCLANLGRRFHCSCGFRGIAAERRRIAHEELIRRFAKELETPAPETAALGPSAKANSGTNLKDQSQ